MSILLEKNLKHFTKTQKCFTHFTLASVVTNSMSVSKQLSRFIISSKEHCQHHYPHYLHQRQSKAIKGTSPTSDWTMDMVPLRIILFQNVLNQFALSPSHCPKVVINDYNCWCVWLFRFSWHLSFYREGASGVLNVCSYFSPWWWFT